MADTEQLLDLLQMAANSGAFICPLAGRTEKPKDHAVYCVACRVRGLVGQRYIAPETEMLERAVNHAGSYRYCMAAAEPSGDYKTHQCSPETFRKP